MHRAPEPPYKLVVFVLSTSRGAAFRIILFHFYSEASTTSTPFALRTSIAAWPGAIMRPVAVPIIGNVTLRRIGARRARGLLLVRFRQRPPPNRSLHCRSPQS